MPTELKVKEKGRNSIPPRVAERLKEVA